MARLLGYIYCMRLFSFFILLLFYSNTQAQTFTLGPKVGVNFSSINFDQKTSIADTSFRYLTQDAKFGLVGGLFFRLKYKKVYFQPEILLAQERTSFNLSTNFDSLGETKEIQFNKIDFPLNFGVKLGKTVRLQAGVVGSYIFSPSINNPKQVFKYATKISTADMQWSYKLGFGFDIRKRATLDINYEGNAGLHHSELNLSGTPFVLDTRKNNIQLTFGIALIPFKK